jgi:hypothetical protein
MFLSEAGYRCLPVYFPASSNRILRGGEKSSSNCPFFTLHINAARNNAATDILAIRRITMALICKIFVKVSAAVPAVADDDQSKN